MFRAYDQIVRFLTSISFIVSAIVALLLMLVGGFDVISTFLFSSPIPAALEIQQSLLAIMIFLGLAHVQRRRDHIRVDLIITLLPPRVQHVLELIVLIIGFCVFAIIAWRSGILALASWNRGETASAVWAFPIYPGKILFALGAALAALECLRQIGWWLKGGETDVHAPSDPNSSS